MWKVTPVGMQNACCAGTWPVANTKKLAAHGNTIPATAPRQYVCVRANTHSLFKSLHWFFFFWPLMKSPRFIAYSREPARTVGEQHGGSWHSRTAASPKTGKPAPPPSWARSSSFQEGSAATAACENGATSFIPPRDVRDICRCCGSQAVVAGRQAGTETGLAFCSRSCACFQEPSAQTSPAPVGVCEAQCWVCFITTD